MGAMARQGPHQVAQKSTSTGFSDFKTSASKFASVTSTIPLPAIFFLLVVTSRCRRTLLRTGVAGRSVRVLPGRGAELIILPPALDALEEGKDASRDAGAEREAARFGVTACV